MNMNVPAAVLEVRQHPASRVNATGIEFDFSPQLHVNFDKETRAIWSRWTADPRPCFNPTLLADIRSYYDFLAASGGQIDCFGEEHPIEYVVLASGMPGVFNLGGDLDLFRQLIDARDGQGLLRYGRACIDVLYRNYVSHELPVTTVSLVQGECLGGGFEAALSSDVIVAERSARFGFPEILFNLFPGMGAYSFLERKIGQKAAEEVLTSGKIYSADEMHALGVVDVLAEDGEGEAAVAALIKRRQRSRNGMAALAAVRRRVHRIDFSELLDIVQIWVDAALRLNPRDLKLMQRLVSRQNDLGESHQAHQAHKKAEGDKGQAIVDASTVQGKADMETRATVEAASQAAPEQVEAATVMKNTSEDKTHQFAAEVTPGAGGGDTNIADPFVLNYSEAATVTVAAGAGDIVLKAENTTGAVVEAKASAESGSSGVGVSVSLDVAAQSDPSVVPDGTLDTDGSPPVNTTTEGGGAAKHSTGVDGALAITVAPKATGAPLVTGAGRMPSADHQGSSATVPKGAAGGTDSAVGVALGLVDDGRSRRRRATLMPAVP